MIYLFLSENSIRNSLVSLSLFITAQLFASSERDAMIEDHYLRGYELSESKEFPRALLELNLAMRHMRHLPKHPRRTDVEQLISRTRERMVVERYLQSNDSNKRKDDNLLPLKFEPEHFRIKQTYGKVLIRNIWKQRERIAPKEYIGEGRQITVLPQGGIELEESRYDSFILRCFDAAGFSLISSNSLQFNSGSFTLCSKRKINGLKIQSNSASFLVSSTQPCAIFVEVGIYGNLHVSSLIGKIVINSAGSSRQLLPGESVIAGTTGLEKVDDLDLGSHYLRSKLTGKFETPPIFYSQLAQQARLQIKYLQFQ